MPNSITLWNLPLVLYLSYVCFSIYSPTYQFFIYLSTYACMHLHMSVYKYLHVYYLLCAIVIVILLVIFRWYGKHFKFVDYTSQHCYRMAAKYLWDCWNIIYIIFCRKLLHHSPKIVLGSGENWVSYLAINVLSLYTPLHLICFKTNTPQNPSVCIVVYTDVFLHLLYCPQMGSWSSLEAWCDSEETSPRNTRWVCGGHSPNNMVSALSFHKVGNHSWSHLDQLSHYGLQKGDLISPSFHFIK